MFHRVEERILSCLKGAIQHYLEKTVSSSSSAEDSKKISQCLNALNLEIPKEKSFGDLSCNIAMRLAGLLKKTPRDIATELIEPINKELERTHTQSLVKSLEIKGAGFINIFLDDGVFHSLLSEVNDKGSSYGDLDLGKGERVCLEFVSANPTGSLSVAHARQAAVGDALANILKKTGYETVREYYLNDVGNQMNILAHSIALRFSELRGEVIEFPENYYQGQYIIDLAKALLENKAQKEKIESLSSEDKEIFFRDYGMNEILGNIKKELDDFGVHFDIWYSQKELENSGKLKDVLAYLQEGNHLYEEDGALWFRSTRYGDDKDRVVRKSDGSFTYLAPDIAYHRDKFARGFQKLINIWGPDHHGYIPRIKAAVEALAHRPESLSVIIVQLATLFRSGTPVPMSTRKGQYVTLGEVLSEVGRDMARFFFLMRKTDSHLDFDLELAKKHSLENPVYYVQYANARIHSILATADKERREAVFLPELLVQPEERELMRLIFGFDDCLASCVRQLDPYPLTTYLQNLASGFHRFYDKHKVLSDNKDLSTARLFLIEAVKNILTSGLTLLGVSAPEKM